jgi:DNA polymerase-3 subunit gamma/tau
MIESSKEQQVFYRKYRPQSLAEVVGQEHVTTTLLNALANDRLSHAYLFCGPRGTGKTSTGRILAKAINCLTNEGKGEPCNKCQMCIDITNGNALDVIEIDAASHTGVDDIRNLIEKIGYVPATAKYKVYIIDEVHMLSNSASNALLKTLEEPPPNVKFVLATTEIHKLLPTIISRCQRFDFKRINSDAIVKQLKYICDSEECTAEEHALRAIANYSRGGLRDSENLLQQVISYYGKDITIANVRELLGTSDGKNGSRIVGYIADRNARDGIQAVGDAQRSGFNLRQLNSDIVGTLRAMMLIKTGCENALDYGADEIAELTKLSEKLPMREIIRLLNIFGKLDYQLTEDNTLPLELGVVEACTEEEAPAAEPKTAVKTATKPAAKAESKPVVKAEPKPVVSEPVQPVKKAVENEIKPVQKTVEAAPEKTESKKAEVKPEAKPAESTVNTSQSVNEYADKYTFEGLKTNWTSILSNVSNTIKRSQAMNILRSNGVEPVSLKNGVLTLSFKYPTLKEMFENKSNIKIATDLFSSYLNSPCKIECLLAQSEDYLVKEAQKMGGTIIRQEEK